MAGEVAFFELGVEDVERGRAFYEGLFGWRFERGPSGEGWTVAAGNVPGGMHGGDKGATPYLFFRVDDMEAAQERVRELGGWSRTWTSRATRRRSPGGPLQALPRRSGVRRSGCIRRRAVPDPTWRGPGATAMVQSSSAIRLAARAAPSVSTGR